MGENVNIGLCGLNFSSKNLGCGALAYSFLEILYEIAKKEQKIFNLYIISASKQSLECKNMEYLQVHIIEYSSLSLNKHVSVRKTMNNCKVVFDFTEGDGFADIYGMKRFISTSVLKLHAILSKTQLILGPQTYGPFNSLFSQKITKYILKKSQKIYARDKKSADYVKKISGKNTTQVIDIAFSLPTLNSKNILFKEDKIKIGINVSGLLWNNGYTGDNELGLQVNYKRYCIELVCYLTNDEKYDVYLIPHVVCEGELEDDLFVCQEIKEMYPKCYVAPRFITPMQAKEYISYMDIFIGARMHATIAAFSTGVATIPFSYSRKFEGLYDTLNYDYCIHGLKEDTEHAINKTISNIANYKKLKYEVEIGNKMACYFLNVFKIDIIDVLVR